MKKRLTALLLAAVCLIAFGAAAGVAPAGLSDGEIIEAVVDSFLCLAAIPCGQRVKPIMRKPPATARWPLC